MYYKMCKKKTEKEIQSYRESKSLIDFFALLLKIDRRINPDLYNKKLTKKKYE